MTQKQFFKLRLYFTAIVALYIGALLLWDYFHGGIPSHYLLQRKDLPEFSNAWGGLFIPLLTWFLLYRIQKRIPSDSGIFKFPTTILYAFIGALCFGIVLSVFFTLEYIELPFYMIVALFVFAFFFPIYRAECFLGFVLGMIYTFGGVLPIIIITVFSLIGAILYLLVRPGVLFVISRATHLVSSKKNNKYQ
jgi:hypothetical protein